MENQENKEKLNLEQRKADALAEVEAFVGDDAFNIRHIFSFGAGEKYLGEKEIVAAIIQKYPQAMEGLSNAYLARNLEDVTKSYVMGVIDVCSDLKNYRKRFIGGPVVYGRNGEKFDIPDNRYIEVILDDAKASFRVRIDGMSKRAVEIVEKDKMIYGSKSRFSGVDEKKLYVPADRTSTGFPDKIEFIGDQAKAAAEIISVEEQERG